MGACGNRTAMVGSEVQPDMSRPLLIDRCSASTESKGLSYQISSNWQAGQKAAFSVVDVVL